MCIFHKWGRWTQYESTSIQYFFTYPYLSADYHQKRVCERCGLMQDKWISSKDVVKLKKAEVVEGDK